MERPFDKHIDDHELNALVQTSSDGGQKLPRLSPVAIREVMRHVELCGACGQKLSRYRQLVNRSNMPSKAVPPEIDCSQGKDVDWHEVAAGLWPELKARQLIAHAALCDQCGPLLRAATNVCDDPTPAEEQFLAELKAPSRPAVAIKPDPIPTEVEARPAWRPLRQWRIFAPALALVVMVAILVTRPPSSRAPLSGSAFAEFALNTHRQRNQGTLALEVRADSAQALNQWFRGNAQFPVTLPLSASIMDEDRPYHLEGAALVPVGRRTAAYIAYQMQTGLVSLIVTPDSVALASGGVAADFKKVSFHYRTLEGYKVVTWSAQGLTYALVSREGNRTQQSCMVCHSAMKDRDLSQTPTPLAAVGNVVQPRLQ